MSELNEDGFEVGETLSERIERERQAAREPLEARVRELEADLAATDKCLGVVMRASSPETFDPQAVRELLKTIAAASEEQIILPSAVVTRAAQRVRESEKK